MDIDALQPDQELFPNILKVPRKCYGSTWSISYVSFTVNMKSNKYWEQIAQLSGLNCEVNKLFADYMVVFILKASLTGGFAFHRYQ